MASKEVYIADNVISLTSKIFRCLLWLIITPYW